MKKRRNVTAEKGEILHISLPVNLKKRFERLAAEKGVDVSSLANLWFIEKLRQAS